VLDTFEFSYQVLRNQDIRQGNLRSRFDIIVLPDQSVNSLLNGHRRGSYPEEYVGGIGEDGVAALRTFVEEGGTLLLVDSASDLAIEKMGVPVRNIVRDMEEDQFYVPGSVLRLKVNPMHPVAYGMPAQTYAYFVNGPVFEPTGPVQVVASWPGKDVLASGWLHGESYMTGRAALVEVPQGHGRMILVGFGALHRAQPHATFKVLFNSIFYAAQAAEG